MNIFKKITNFFFKKESLNNKTIIVSEIRSAQILFNNLVVGFAEVLCYSEDYPVKLSANLFFKSLPVGLFNGDFISPGSQSLPFEIFIITDKNKEIKIHNAWLRSTGYTYNVGDDKYLPDVKLYAEKVLFE